MKEALLSSDARPQNPDVAPHLSWQSIIADPLFPAARKAYIDAALALYENKPQLNRLMYEAGQMVMFGSLLCLHARYDEAERDTWPTIGRLKQTLALFGFASSRQIDSVVARLIASGFLARRTAARDRRVRIVVPTEKMVAHDLEWLAAHYLPLAMMFPDPGYALAMAGDRQFQKAQRRAAIETFPWSVRIMSENAAIGLFLARDAGVLILFKLFQAVEASESALAHLSFADVATRFGVSRTHVRTLFQDAEAQGLLRLSGRGHADIEITGQLATGLDRLVAESMSLHDVIYYMALRPFESDRPPTR